MLEDFVIKFTAEWCAPCKQLAPLFKELSEEIKKFFFEVNVDEEQKLAQLFNILSIPTIVIVRNGKEIGRINGMMPKQQLKEKIMSSF